MHGGVPAPLERPRRSPPRQGRQPVLAGHAHSGRRRRDILLLSLRCKFPVQVPAQLNSSADVVRTTPSSRPRWRGPAHRWMAASRLALWRQRGPRRLRSGLWLMGGRCMFTVGVGIVVRGGCCRLSTRASCLLTPVIRTDTKSGRPSEGEGSLEDFKKAAGNATTTRPDMDEPVGGQRILTIDVGEDGDTFSPSDARDQIPKTILQFHFHPKVPLTTVTPFGPRTQVKSVEQLCRPGLLRKAVRAARRRLRERLHTHRLGICRSRFLSCSERHGAGLLLRRAALSVWHGGQHKRVRPLPLSTVSPSRSSLLTAPAPTMARRKGPSPPRQARRSAARTRATHPRAVP